MRVICNIIWFIFGGLWLGLFWGLLGAILCVTIIGIPLGLQCFKAAKLTFAPFGKSVHLHFLKHPVANVLWAILVGWEMALGYLMSGIMCCATIIGIPIGIQAFKLTKLALLPFGSSVEKR